MAEDLISSTGKALVYEDQVPLRWSPVEAPLPAAQLASLDQRNEEMLAFIAALEEYKGDGADDEHEPHRQELLRVEHKINLLLEMVGQLLARHADLPGAVPVRLSPGAIEWRSENAPAVGERLLLEIFINKKYPSPLVFPGRVRQVDAQDQGGAARIVVEFEQGSDAVTHALEKMIFRHHRRRIAHVRGHQSAQGS